MLVPFILLAKRKNPCHVLLLQLLALPLVTRSSHVYLGHSSAMSPFFLLSPPSLIWSLTIVSHLVIHPPHCLKLSFWNTVFSRCMPGVALAGSYHNSIFSFLSNFHTVLTEAAPIYIPTNSLGRFPFPSPSPASIIVDFSMMTILTGVRSPPNGCIMLLTLPVRKNVVFNL